MTLIIKYVCLRVPNTHVHYENMLGKFILFNMTPELLNWYRIGGTI